MPRLAASAASLALAFGAAGCATSSAAAARDATVALVRYGNEIRHAFPPDSYIVGVGQSAASAWAAEMSARLAAAVTLRGSLRGEVGSVEMEAHHQGGTSVTRVARQTVSLVTDTDLAPYFRPAMEYARFSDGYYLAVVAARRADLGARLALEAGQHEARALDAFARVIAGRDLLGQARAWCEARRLHLEFTWRVVAYHLVSGESLASPELDDRARKATQAVAETRAELPVLVRFHGPEDPLLSAISGLVAERIRAAGFVAEIRASPNRKRPVRQGQLDLVLARSTGCSQPSPGIFQCSLNVQLEVHTGGAGGATLLSVHGEPSVARDMSSAGSASAESLASSRFDQAAFAALSASQVLCLLGPGCQP